MDVLKDPGLQQVIGGAHIPLVPWSWVELQVEGVRGEHVAGANQ